MEIKIPKLLDGAMGTMLQRSGMKPGTIPETLNITAPETVAAIHRAYLRAGSQAVYANTFGANSLKMKDTGYTLREIIGAGVRIAKECAAETGALAGLDVGPLGVMLEPIGSLPFGRAVELYKEIMRAGEESGADLIAIETMSDLAETRAALLAAKEATGLPVFVTMSFDATGRTFTGCTPASMARTLEGLGADAVGVNCSLGPKEMVPIIREIRENTRLPVIAKPNAGLPDPVTGAYGVDAAEFAAAMREIAAAGADILGGCCGTDPEYIRALAGETFPGRTWTPEIGGAVCTGPVCLRTGGIRVIGERINPTGKKRLQQALLEEDMDYLVEMAIRQADAGADLLDVNVGYPGVDEVSMLPRAVQAIQAAVDLPLQIDTTNPEALEAALRVFHGKAAVNSVNGKEESLAAVLPLVKKYGAAVVGLTLDEDGIPDTAEKRLAIARKILERATALGIPREDVWIDCLTLTVSAQQEQAKETLRAVRLVTEELGLQTVLGVSNISFGLPSRLLMTQTFLACAMEAGLKLPIVNPNQREIMDVVAARRVLSGEDAECRKYVERFAEETPESRPAAAAAGKPGMTLGEAIRKGLRKEAGRLTAEALREKSGMELVEKELIPALEETGERYEQGKVFLPQLLSAAQAAQAAFEEIRGALLKKGEKSADRGEVIMATVQGDIHNISKNIVITVLENYGYRVRDLGKDVAPETIVREAQEKGIRLVGLSALMTTTLPAMAETVQQLKALPDPPAVMVGGAVVTAEYAKSIGADYYAKDVRDAVKVTRLVFSF